MKQFSHFLLAGIILMFLFSSVVQGQIPKTISFQGVLTDSLGKPVDDGQWGLTFRLYDDSAEGIQLWNETKVVQTSSGLFSTILGSVMPFGSSVKFDKPYWLALQADGQPEMAPRIPLTAVGYSFNSLNSDTAQFAKNIPDGIVTETKIANNTITSAKIVDGTIAGSDFANASITSAKIATGQVVKGLNGLRDNIYLSAVGGATVNSSNDTIYINAGSGGGGTGIQGIQNTNNTIDIINPNGPTATINVKSGVFLPLTGGMMSGAITSSGGPAITMGKGNFGVNNINTGTDAFVAGRNNRARGDYSVASGGGGTAYSDSNSAIGSHSTIGGGRINLATGERSTIGGGSQNLTSGFATTVAGGRYNTASSDYATVGGGNQNRARGQFSVVSGGGGAEVDSNSAIGDYSTVGGGRSNKAILGYATVGGGFDNTTNGTSATVSGGESNGAINVYTTVSGGFDNLASGNVATVSGGRNNTASGIQGTVSGGSTNIASGDVATVSGGTANTASGWGSTVCGGKDNTAAGNYSFAAGHRAKAIHNGAFVWADQSNFDFVSLATNQFFIRASGGTHIYSNPLATSGVRLAAGASAWDVISDSTKKRNIRLVNTKHILDKVENLPVKQWSYLTQDPSIEHIGPMAQDFYAAFGLGEDDKTISTIDPAGVALAAIKGLIEENKELRTKNEELIARLNQLETTVKLLVEGTKSTDSKSLGELR